MRTEFHMYVGIPSSGKSYCVEEDRRDYEANGYSVVVISSDAIREEISNVNDQSQNNRVFEIARDRVIAAIDNDYDIILYDACNICRKWRKGILDSLPRQMVKMAYVVAAPMDVILERNKNRGREVPEEAIWRMAKLFEIPTADEGFDDVIPYVTSKKPWKEYAAIMMGFNQENSHHTHDLEWHCEQTAYRLKNWGFADWIQKAALIHDVGKLYTKTHFNAKGEWDEDCHYYSHENVGAYLSLSIDWEEVLGGQVLIDIATLVNYHMVFYGWENFSEKKKRKWRWRFDDLWKYACVLHKADELAH